MAKKKTKSPVVSVLKTYEIRKIINAANIVDAFNMDPVTPPDYIVMTDEGEPEELESAIGS